jgi:hypothetical protein
VVSEERLLTAKTGLRLPAAHLVRKTDFHLSFKNSTKEKFLFPTPVS